MPSPFYATTPKYALRSLLGTSNVSDTDAGFLAALTDVENAFTGYKSGTNAARLAATNIDGLLWRETDTAGTPLYLGTGTTWVQLTPSRGATNIATAEALTSASYGLLTTPDQIQNVILPTNGKLIVEYQASWKESPSGVARAAIFIGSNQLKIAQESSAPQTEAAATGGATANTYVPLSSAPIGLVSTILGGGYAGDVTTGQAIGLYTISTASGGLFAEVHGSVVSVNAASTAGMRGGSCEISAAAGIYTISVQFKATSGTVTAQNRKLWVQAVPGS